jgi:tRNA nucleotidyltransferase (CCA-adding enzyme)
MGEIPQAVAALLQTLETAGHAAWCVGGCVRDSLLLRAPQDWDVTTDALPEETLALFAPRALPTGLRHGTVTVKTAIGGVEVTTFRCDGPYADFRHPGSVRFTRSLREDLARRDFTVNAMALDLRGALCDPFGGRADLERRLLRCVGTADERLREDALRILRCLRFASVLGFAVEEETAEALHRQRELLSRIAPERVREELEKLLCGPGAGAVLRAFPDVAGVVLPELEALVGFEQCNRHHCFDVYEHTLHALDAAQTDPVVRWAVLLHDIGKPKCFTEDADGVGHFRGHPAVSGALADAALRRLKFSRREREAVVQLVEWHDRNIPRTEAGIRRALLELGETQLRRLLAVKRADNLAQAAPYRAMQQEIRRAEELLEGQLREGCWSLRQLAVSGEDLAALGLRGPQIGAELKRLLAAVVDGALPNQRAALLASASGLSDSSAPAGER